MPGAGAGPLRLALVKVLVIGTGAREHAIVRALTLDPSVDAVIAAPGNPGIDAIALCRELPKGLLDGEGIAALAVELRHHGVERGGGWVVRPGSAFPD